MRTGGNDNAVRVWSASKLGAGAQELQGHGAAVKARWPGRRTRGAIASRRAWRHRPTADRSIKIWDAARGLRLSTVDTGSQVCALAWSSAEDALVSAHGYSLNQILIWRLPELARDGARTAYLCLAGHGPSTRPLPRAVARQPRRRHGRGRRVARFWACFGRRRSGPGGLLSAAGFARTQAYARRRARGRSALGPGSASPAVLPIRGTSLRRRAQRILHGLKVDREAVHRHRRRHRRILFSRTGQ